MHPAWRPEGPQGVSRGAGAMNDNHYDALSLYKEHNKKGRLSPAFFCITA